MSQPLLYTCVWRFINEDRSIQAAGLTFYTLFALAPLAALGLSLIGWVSIFPDQAVRIEAFFLKNFVPQAAGAIEHYLHSFTVASAKLSRINLLIFLLTSIFLINSIEACFNQIWRTKIFDSWAQRFIHYAMVLIVSPLCLGLSMGLSAVLLSLSWLQHPVILSGISEIVKLLPFLLTWLSVTTLYYWLPQPTVKLKNVFFAGFVVAFLFELMKYAFQYYVVIFTTYQIVYGAIALLLIFLLWIYLSWSAVLLGAILASEMPDQH
jgi:membrane protein